MKKYFYSDGTNNHGPFTLEELKEKNITRETPVWYEGLGDWTPAGQVSEVKEIFKLTPPPIRSSTTSTSTGANYNNPGKPPKSWLVESILVTLFCCLPLGIVGIVNSSNVESRFYAGDIEGANKASVEAGKWTKISFWIGISVGVIYLLFVVLSVVASGF